MNAAPRRSGAKRGPQPRAVDFLHPLLSCSGASLATDGPRGSTPRRSATTGRIHYKGGETPPIPWVAGRTIGPPGDRLTGEGSKSAPNLQTEVEPPRCNHNRPGPSALSPAPSSPLWITASTTLQKVPFVK